MVEEEKISRSQNRSVKREDEKGEGKEEEDDDEKR